jgi:hypothetical protein
VENEIGETISMRSLNIPKVLGIHICKSLPAKCGTMSVPFGNPKRNSIFFSPTLVFHFFVTNNRNQNSWPESAKTFTNSNLTSVEDRRPACSMNLAQWRAQCLNKSSDSHQISLYIARFMLRNQSLRQAQYIFSFCNKSSNKTF